MNKMGEMANTRTQTTGDVCAALPELGKLFIQVLSCRINKMTLETLEG